MIDLIDRRHAVARTGPEIAMRLSDVDKRLEMSTYQSSTSCRE